tara:strand:+ start:2782 stop:3150 length:369 start_codon:yes stop_codon:yes gene_type:complete
MKRLFKIYNRLTDISDHEYKFMVENKSKYIDKAKRIIRSLDFQEIYLDRLDGENDPDTGSSYCLAWSTEATVYDPISEDRQEDKIDENGNRKKIISENNYGNPDVFVIAKILQELDEEKKND